MSLQKYIETKRQMVELDKQLKASLEEANREYWELDGKEAFGATLTANTQPKAWLYSDKLSAMVDDVKRLKKIEELDGTAADVTKPFDTKTMAAFKVKL